MLVLQRARRAAGMRGWEVMDRSEGSERIVNKARLCPQCGGAITKAKMYDESCSDCPVSYIWIAVQFSELNFCLQGHIHLCENCPLHSIAACKLYLLTALEDICHNSCLSATRHKTLIQLRQWFEVQRQHMYGRFKELPSPPPLAPSLRQKGS